MLVIRDCIGLEPWGHRGPYSVASRTPFNAERVTILRPEPRRDGCVRDVEKVRNATCGYEVAEQYRIKFLSLR